MGRTRKIPRLLPRFLVLDSPNRRTRLTYDRLVVSAPKLPRGITSPFRRRFTSPWSDHLTLAKFSVARVGIEPTASPLSQDFGPCLGRREPPSAVPFLQAPFAFTNRALPQRNKLIVSSIQTTHYRLLTTHLIGSGRILLSSFKLLRAGS